MKASLATLVLAATAAIATPSANRHKLFHRQSKRAPVAAVDARDTTTLNSLLAPLGIPVVAGSASVYPGASGPYTQEITNNAGEPVAFVAWANGQFKLDSSSPPLLTELIPDGQTITISMADGYSGAMTTVHANTEAATSGMINNTLIEMTTGAYGVVDLSREVTMQGTNITVSQNDCTTSWTQCVFTCPEGTTCGWNTPYELTNCATGSQKGASYGTYGGAPSGGCMIENHMTTTIHPSS